MSIYNNDTEYQKFIAELPEPNLSKNCLTVLENRYLRRDKDNKPEETPKELFARVAWAISAPQLSFKEEVDRMTMAKNLYNAMVDGRIMFNSPTLFNAGTGNSLGLSACYVRVPEDSLDSIMEVCRDLALIQKAGGGVGYNFSKLRPKGSMVSTCAATTDGPLPFIDMYCATTNAIQQGAKRRGAQMGMLDITHPDVWQFIQAKADLSRWQNMNVSLLVTNDWMYELKSKPKSYHKVSHPKWGEGYLVKDCGSGQYHPVKWDGPVEELEKGQQSVDLILTKEQLFYKICERAWTTGEPGLVFIDRVQKDWKFKIYNINRIEATNPCVIGSTLITTKEGPKPIDSLVGSAIDIWNGHEWTTVSPRVTGYQKDVVRITFSDGSDLTCTLNHRFAIEGSKDPIEAKDLKAGHKLQKFTYPIISGTNSLDPVEAYTMGVFSGDGSIHTETGKRYIWLYGKKKAILNHINKRTSAECDRDRICATLDNKTWSKTFVPNATYDTITKLNWLSGLLDTDGSYNGTGSVSINSSNKDFLYEIKLMLMCLGTPSILAMYKDKEDKMMPDGKGGKKLYTCQPSYRLSIAGYYVTQLIGLGLSPKLLDIKHLVKRSQAKNITIVNIENGLKADTVYCFTDPKRSMGLFNCVSTLNCGEQPLENGGNCTLASINLAKYYDPATNFINRQALIDDAILMQHALDNVVEINTFPVDIVTEQNKKTRRIGGGIMGWADLLFLMGVPYNSEAARTLAETIMQLISDASYGISKNLAKTRGTFLDWEQSDYTDKIRNAYRNTVAPTGTISIIADCSGGIEPIFSLAFTREVLQGANGRRVKMFEGNKIFETKLRQWLDSKCTGDAKNLIEDFVKEIIKHAATKGTIKDYMGTPALWEGWKEFISPFVTTKDIAPNDHVLMQAAWQKHVDTAISKTINLNNDATVEDVIAAYKLAYETKCKGITVYRDGSRDGVAGMAQPMKLDKSDEKPKEEAEAKPTFHDIKWESPSKIAPAASKSEVFNALKIKQATPMGNLHVTCVLDESNLPVEIFAQISKAGEQPAADLEAMCRLASMYLRESKNFDEVIKQLEHIGSSTLMPSKDGQIKSLPDGLSLALKKIKKVLSNDSSKKIDTTKVTAEKIHIPSNKNDQLYSEVCPVCSKKLIRAEGCLKCDPSCGFSKC